MNYMTGTRKKKQATLWVQTRSTRAGLTFINCQNPSLGFAANVVGDGERAVSSVVK